MAESEYQDEKIKVKLSGPPGSELSIKVDDKEIVLRS